MVEQAVIDSLRALYREADVQKCLVSRTHNDLSTGAYHAYRRKEWDARTHWPVFLADEHVPPNGRILVVGCGMGQMCMWFAEAGYAVTGIDIVPEFIDIARQATEMMSPDERPGFFAVEGYQWPFGVEEFDCVAMMATFLTHCPTAIIRSRLFSEACRVLRPEGCLLVEAADRTHPGCRHGSQATEIHDDALPALLTLHGLPGVIVHPFHPFRSDAVSATPTAWYFADPRDIWEELEAVGLRVIRLQTEQDPTDANPCVTLVATKALPRRMIRPSVSGHENNADIRAGRKA